MISCPRCESTFETQAVTSTRCRSCHTVVRVGGSARSSTAKSPGWELTSVRAHTPEPDETAEGNEVLFLVGAAVVVVGVVAFIRCWRRRRASEQAREDEPAPDSSEWERAD